MPKVPATTNIKVRIELELSPALRKLFSTDDPRFCSACQNMNHWHDGACGNTAVGFRHCLCSCKDRRTSDGKDG
jgi:hypothetical protein